MEHTKSSLKTFEYFFNLKERKITVEQYIILKKAFLEGLLITKEWLQNIEKNNPEQSGIIDKTLNHINFQTAEHDLSFLETLRSDETEDLFKFLDSMVVLRPSVVPKTTKILPSQKNKVYTKVPLNIISKEELKNEINTLYQQKDSYDLCLSKTTELLQHPDLTDEEKNRYQNFYQELLEWVNLKNKQKEEKKKTEGDFVGPESNANFESRGTSISQLRADMMKELNKLRQMYIDNDDE